MRNTLHGATERELERAREARRRANESWIGDMELFK